MLGQRKHIGSWDGARTRDGVMGNEYSQLSQEPLGRWTKAPDLRDVSFSGCRYGQRVQAQAAKRKADDSSERCQQDPKWWLEEPGGECRERTSRVLCEARGLGGSI